MMPYPPTEVAGPPLCSFLLVSCYVFFFLFDDDLMNAVSLTCLGIFGLCRIMQTLLDTPSCNHLFAVEGGVLC